MPRPCDLVIDTREKPKRAARVAKEAAGRGLEVCRRVLPAGDYYIPPPTSDGEGLVFEVKTPTDLLNTLTSARLFRQIQALASAANAKPYVALIGWIGAVSRFSSMQPHTVMRVAEGIQGLGVGMLLFSGDARFAEYIVARAAALAGHRTASPDLLVEERVDLRADPCAKALYALETVTGPATAKALLAAFGSLEGLAGASLAELENVSVGGRRLGRRARRIYSALHPSGTN